MQGRGLQINGRNSEHSESMAWKGPQPNAINQTQAGPMSITCKQAASLRCSYSDRSQLRTDSGQQRDAGQMPLSWPTPSCGLTYKFRHPPPATHTHIPITTGCCPCGPKACSVPGCWLLLAPYVACSDQTELNWTLPTKLH